jgi:hypothetical protein
VWRGEPLEVNFYAFWRVRLVLHVTAKGIYIPGFCTYTFHTYIYINSIHSCTSVITLYHLYTCNRLLLHLIIVYPLLVCMLFIALYLYMRLLLVLLLGFLVSFL